jgi:AAA15 family ATPase/GTPase
MRYTFFEIENFRGIRHARIDLSQDGSSSRVFTLVGLNESGKTTVLEAIDLFQGADDEDPSPKELGGWLAPEHHTLIPIAERANFNGKVTIRCGVELDDDDVDAARKYFRRIDGYRLTDLNRSITIEDEYIFKDSRFVKRNSLWHRLSGTGKSKQGKVERDLTHNKDLSRWRELATFTRMRLPKIWYFPDFLFDFPDLINLEEVVDESKQNRFYRTLFQDILDALGHDLQIEPHVVERECSATESDHENLRQVLLEAGRHVTDSVVAAWNEIFKDKAMSKKAVQIEIARDSTRPPSDERAFNVSVRFRIEDSDGVFAVRERSRGFRWFFVYLLITTYRGGRSAGPADMLFLFDEPASNLHSMAQRALLKSFGDLSKQAVIIYTTHSHHLIEPKWLGTTFVVANQAIDPRVVSPEVIANRTDIQVTPYRRFAASHPAQRHYFQPILDVLDYAPAPLEFVPEVVMVEGKSDYYLLRYFEEVLVNPPPDESLSFLPGGGSGTLDDVIQLYLAWSRPFVALLDSDKSGTAQVRRYTQKFGKIVEPHLTTLSVASGKSTATAIESLLVEGDRLALQRVLDPKSSKYDKALLALGVQEALLLGKPVKFSVTATKALTATIVSLRAQLDAVAGAG